MLTKAFSTSLRYQTEGMSKPIGNPVDLRQLALPRPINRASGTSEKRSSSKRRRKIVCKLIGSCQLLRPSNLQTRWKLMSAQVIPSAGPLCNLQYRSASAAHLFSSAQNRGATISRERAALAAPLAGRINSIILKSTRSSRLSAQGRALPASNSSSDPLPLLRLLPHRLTVCLSAKDLEGASQSKSRPFSKCALEISKIYLKSATVKQRKTLLSALSMLRTFTSISSSWTLSRG